MQADQASALPMAETVPPAIALPDAPAQPAPAASTWKRPFLALEERAYRALWVSTLPGVLAMSMEMVVTGYVAYDISGAAAAIGVVSLGATIPMMLLGLFGGVVADRVPKRTILMCTQGVIGLAALANALLVLSGVVQIWHLVLVATMQGVAYAFNMPARQAFIAQLVSAERLTNAIALHSASANLARVVGPTAAGGLIALPFFGPGHVYLVMACMYGYVVVALSRVPQRGEPVGGSRAAPLRAVADGLRYIRSNGVVLTLLLLACVPMLLASPYQQLMPVFAKDIFGIGPAGLGLLLTLNGVGALTGSLLIASLSGVGRRGVLQMALGMCFGLAVATFAFARSFEVALLVLPLAGVASGGFQALNGSLIISRSAPAYTGRVMSVYMLTFATMDIGVVTFGALADRFGAPTVVGIGGLLVTSVIAAVGLLHPSYRNMR